MLNLTQVESFGELYYLLRTRRVYMSLSTETPPAYLCEMHQLREEALIQERTMTSYGSGESLGILKVYRTDRTARFQEDVNTSRNLI